MRNASETTLRSYGALIMPKCKDCENIIQMFGAKPNEKPLKQIENILEHCYYKCVEGHTFANEDYISQEETEENRNCKDFYPLKRE
jgi:hypothetical protein